MRHKELFHKITKSTAKINGRSQQLTIGKYMYLSLEPKALVD